MQVISSSQLPFGGFQASPSAGGDSLPFLLVAAGVEVLALFTALEAAGVEPSEVLLLLPLRAGEDSKVGRPPMEV